MAFARLGSLGSGFGRVGAGAGPSGPAAAAGGAALLAGETNGFATDFTYATDASRVAVKTAGTVTAYAVDSFFTQAGTSPKMVYDSAGVLGWAPHNLILHSKDANDYVLSSGVTITANAAAGPLGDVTADQLAFDGGNNDYYYKGTLDTVITPGTAYCGSVWLKATAPVQIGFRCFGSAADGSQTAAVVNVTTVWQQFYGVCVLGPATQIVYVTLDLRSGVTGDDGLAKTVIAADWQVNRGTVPTAYLPTTTAARFGLAIDYDPVTHAAKGLLCEPAATNNCLRSSEMDNATWGLSLGVISANATTAPNGLVEADGFIPNSGTSSAYFYQFSMPTANGAANTFSIYAKNGTLGNNWIQLLAVGSSWAAWFNLATGAKGTSSASPTDYTITAIGSGWYRVTITFTAIATTTSMYVVPRNADGGLDVTGNGSSPAFYAWGGQMESGTVATSYIPTTSATVTRAADQPFFLLNTIPALSTEFTLYGRWQTPSPTSNRFAYCVTDSLGTPGDYAGLFASTSARLTVADGTATQATIAAGTIVANTSLSIAGRSKANDFSASMNGAAVVADVTGTQPTGLTHVRFGNTGGNAAATALFHVEKMVILPRGMSNAELVVRSAT